MGWLSRVWLFVGTIKNVEIYLLLTTNVQWQIFHAYQDENILMSDDE